MKGLRRHIVTRGTRLDFDAPGTAGGRLPGCVPRSSCPPPLLGVGTSGLKGWLFRFKWNGNSIRFALGIFPSLGSAEAREGAGAKWLLLKRGIDPRKAARPERNDFITIGFTPLCEVRWIL
jgi:hypothetical protein